MGYTKKETMRAYFRKPINRLKVVYYAMRNRCYNKNNNSYKNYGAKGITVCDEWLNNPNSFYKWAMDNGFKYEIDENGRNKHTIDRINPKKGYSPENCRWVSLQEQNTNRSDNIYIEYKGEKRTLNCWCKLLNLSYPKMYYRIHFKNMSLEQAILGKDFTFGDKKPATNYRYIYKQKTSYVVEIKKKYYGRRKSLQDAIKLRNSILENMGLLQELKDFELKGEKDVKD